MGEVSAPDIQRILERLDRIDRQIEEHFRWVQIRLDDIEQQRGRVPRRVADVIDRIDELALRFEGAECLLGQLAEQILELRTAGAVIVPPSLH